MNAPSLAFVVALAQQAGELLRAGYARGSAIEIKGTYEIVTETDRASEALIVAAIRERHPDHAILAEEGSGIEQPSAYRWTIDPLDGTNNFAHGVPFFSVSIALLHNDQPLLGVVFNPLSNELFSAERGRGAFLGSQRLHVSETSALAASLLSTGFSYDYAERTDNNLAEFDRLQACTQGVRRMGSAALDLCFVGAGRFAAHWEYRLSAWDSAAGALVVAEAGGQLSDLAGDDWSPASRTIVASNGHIHAPLLRALRG